MRQRGAALALLLCLTLTACGGQGGGQASFLGEAAGLDEEHPLLTVDGREVPAWRYLYWLASACDQIRTRYQESGLTLDWRAAVDDGTLADYAKSQALADTALYATVENWAEEYGCELTEADQALLESSWSQQTALQSAALAALGLDRSRAEELWTVGLLYSQLCQLSQTAGSPLYPAGGEAAGTALVVDRILVAAGSDREAARQQAEALFAQLNSAQDQAAAFSALAASGDDPAGPRLLPPGESVLAPTLEAAAAVLAVDQCSGILESEEGFSILRRLAADQAPPESDAFDQRLQAAAAQADIQTGEGYDRLDAAAFDQALERLRAEGLGNSGPASEKSASGA